MQHHQTTGPLPQGKYSYRLLHRARFNCYFLPVFWKLQLALAFLLLLPATGTGIRLLLSGRISGHTLALLLLACVFGIATPVTAATALWAHHRAKHAPPLPAGDTTLEWDPYALRVTVNGEHRVYFWKDVHRYRFLGQNIVLRFPDGGRTGLFPGRAPASVRDSLAAAVRQGKKARGAADAGGNGPVIS